MLYALGNMAVIDPDDISSIATDPDDSWAVLVTMKTGQKFSVTKSMALDFCREADIAAPVFVSANIVGHLLGETVMRGIMSDEEYFHGGDKARLEREENSILDRDRREHTIQY